MISRKLKIKQVEQLVGGILDSQDTDTIVVRGKACEVLYMNAAAINHLPANYKDETRCHFGYSHIFSDLCDKCPHLSSKPLGEATHFDTYDEKKRLHSVIANTISWIDGKPATILYLRDVDNERNVTQKLYNLAYVDQLTGVPNRQKFKEDFEAVRHDIEDEKQTGVVVIFDLDNFKNINDTYGHNTGDIMLRRLTEHLSQDPAFTGHLYRLGGDEFVLFYSDQSTRFSSQKACSAHYEKLLKRAFLAYTMPNIETYCTISMGVSFFPQHGVSSSELLRKADIALYKAKTGGRNRLVFFEDRYDTAKKFKDLYINIQPILTAHETTFGYELVDRGNEGLEDENALNLSEFNRTLDALGLNDLDNNAHYFIAFTNQLLSHAVLKNLPRDKFIIQISLIEPVTEPQMEKYRQLHAHGYSIALAGLNEINMTPELISLAAFCRFQPGGMDIRRQNKLIANNPSLKFIATSVDSADQFEEAKRRGFVLFSGFFFNQPIITRKTKDIDPLKINYFRLLQLTSTDDYVDFREISAVISSDVALSYKLLRLLNSASVGLRNQISSIDAAIAYLGEENLKKWISMLALRGTASDKPLELVRISLIRAHFGELLAPHFVPKRNAKHVFLMGLLSLLHIALEKSPTELLDEVPVSEDIRDSLLTKNGPYSDLISFFSNYEYANWEEVTRFANEHQISDGLINDSYIESVKWYNGLSDA